MAPPKWTHTGYTQRLYFGVNTVDRLSEIAKDLGAPATHAGDHRGTGRVGRRRGDHEAPRPRHGLEVRPACARTFPPTIVQAAMLQARRDGIDGVVSFGGGSCMDLGKAVCFFTEQEAGTPGASYRRPSRARRTSRSRRRIPVPSCTPFFGMTDPATTGQDGRRRADDARRSPSIYDPVLTLSTPARVSAETGMNALAHCVEAVYVADPHAGGRGHRAGRRRARSSTPCRAVVDDPDDVDRPHRHARRGRCWRAAACRTRAMGVHHGLAQLIGGRTGIPHGLANAIDPPARDALQRRGRARGDGRLGEAIGDPSDPAAAVERLLERCGLPVTLQAAGVRLDDLDAVARLSQNNDGVRHNPLSGERGRCPRDPRRGLLTDCAENVALLRRWGRPRRSSRRASCASASEAPITAGISSSRASTAAWESGPPSTVTIAPTALRITL